MPKICRITCISALLLAGCTTPNQKNIVGTSERLPSSVSCQDAFDRNVKTAPALLRLYSKSTPLPFTLTTDLAEIVAKRASNSSEEEPSDRAWTPGTLLIKEKNLVVQIRARLNTSNSDDESAFPKLRVKIKKNSESNSEFAGVNGFRINTHLNTNPQSKLMPMGRLNGENSPWREALAYRLASVIGLVVPGTRLAQVTYLDSKTQQPLTRKALLIETDKSAFARYEGNPVVDAEFTSAETSGIDPVDGAEFLLFHKMIGNEDVQLRVNQEPIVTTEIYRSMWNTSVLQFKNGSRLPMVYDLDMATMMTGKPREKADANFGFKNALQSQLMAGVARLFPHFTKAQLKQALDRIKCHKQELYDTVNTSLADAEGNDIAKRHLDLFFSGVDEILKASVTLDAKTVLWKDVGMTQTLVRANSMTEQPGTLRAGTAVKVLEKLGQVLKVVVLDSNRDLQDSLDNVGYIPATAAIGDSVSDQTARGVDEREMVM